MHLLDVNVLVALTDAGHEFHDPAIRWFARARSEGWATCPITENGLVRIIGHASYPGGPNSLARARRLLQTLVRTPGHAFWADEISLVDSTHFPSLEGVKASILTDIYLLSLAVYRGGTFASFDRRIDAAAIPKGEKALIIVPT